MQTDNSRSRPAFPYRERRIECALRTLVAAAAGLPGMQDTLAWRMACLVSTETDPSESLMREAFGALREALEARGALPV